MIKHNKILRGAFFIPLVVFFLLSPLYKAQASPSIDYPFVKLQSLDKVTARTMTFEAKVGSTVKFGSLYIKAQSCRKTSDMEQPEAAAFLQIWENPEEGEAQWVFSGWMFASSPGLSPIDHPIYDVWVLDCFNASQQPSSTATAKEGITGDAKEGEGILAEDQVPQQPKLQEQP